ncbi:unnamed protein product [Cylindrotheca closterium]|uniref:Uncharacterized protein n=1 Tax=Cylindrotheca closterium TaxID=2856 RepID=A0AAD2CLC5_9STRA|nr:unnamed protein product [Cylindrotheca closterium]
MTCEESPISSCSSSPSSSSEVEVEPIAFEYGPSPLNESADADEQLLWPLYDERQERVESEGNSDTTASTCTSSNDKDSTASASAVSYFENLALKLRSHNNSHSIRIISDSAATHSLAVDGKSRLSFPSLPSIDEYNALDVFMPALLKEKGFVHSMETLSIVSDNPSSCTPSSAASSQLPSNDSYQLPCGEQEADDDEVVDHVIESCPSQEHEIVRVGRSYSLDAGYSTPKPSKAKRSVARSVSFQGRSNRQDDIKQSISSNSPQSVMDIFNPEAAAELRSSFATL